jgi:hypothetical protein
MEIQTEGRFTIKIYPYFVQPGGMIEWSGELLLYSTTIVHVTSAQSHDDASALLEVKIKAIHAELGEVIKAFAVEMA